MSTPYVATGPEDLIALAPTVLRFDPHESVVVLTFGRPDRSFHARVELPRKPRDQDEVADTLLKAMSTNDLRDCAVLVYSEDRAVAAAQARKLNRKLRRAGIRVVDVLHIHGDRYYRVLRADDRGTRFDISSHPFTAMRVLDGIVVHKSREDLAATVSPDPSSEERAGALLAEVEAWLEKEVDVVAEAQWIRTTVDAAVESGAFDEEEVARVLADLAVPMLTDVAWAGIVRSQARAQVELWRGVVRIAPQAYVDGPACLLAFAAWLSGDGALAWCALDRCGPAPLPMADMVNELLCSAVSPRLWPALSAEELTALRGPAA